MTFEDPTQLARCIKSDCQGYRAGNTPLCAEHLREQEVLAGATSISEPELEEKARAAGDAVMKQGPQLIGQDPDTQTLEDVRTVGGRIAMSTPLLEEMQMLHRPSPEGMEPVWNKELKAWVLQPKRHGPDLKVIEGLLREMMAEFGIWEEDRG